MNVTIYAESFDWLFAQRCLEHPCLWSFGRHRPPVDIGDDLIFRRDGYPMARAIVRGIYAPGELDVDMHDGSRRLTGWKVLWYQSDFQDLREAKLPKQFGTPLTAAMDELLRQNVGGVIINDEGEARTARGLIDRRLVQRISPRAAVVTSEGWRVLLREISDQRRKDIAHVFGRAIPVERRRDHCRALGVKFHTFVIGDMGTWCCRICGCTDGHGCEEGCSWDSINLCTRCAPLIEAATANAQGAHS